MTLTVVGIDPGETGGLALINGSVFAMPMPDIWTFSRMLKFEGEFNRNIHVFIERSQSFPKQGVASSFNYGKHYGELLGVLVAHSIKHTLVPPATWTRALHVGTKAGDSKARTLEAVRRLFPGTNLVATERSRKPHLGIVDALAIAYYGRYYLQREVNTK